VAADDGVAEGVGDGDPAGLDDAPGDADGPGEAEGDPVGNGGVATVDVEDIKAEADRLRGEGVNVGVVLELAGQMRLVDVFDPDGNRIQLAQPLE